MKKLIVFAVLSIFLLALGCKEDSIPVKPKILPATFPNQGNYRLELGGWDYSPTGQGAATIDSLGKFYCSMQASQSAAGPMSISIGGTVSSAGALTADAYWQGAFVFSLKGTFSSGKGSGTTDYYSQQLGTWSAKKQ
jgi:hypothetical protein